MVKLMARKKRLKKLPSRLRNSKKNWDRRRLVITKKTWLK